MKINRLDSSNTMPRYEVIFESDEEVAYTKNQLLDKIESLNYGGSIQYRDNQKALLQVYID